MLNSNLIERLEARANGIASALNEYSNKSFDDSVSSAVVPSFNSVCRMFLNFFFHPFPNKRKAFMFD